MNEYKRCVSEILSNGERKANRTGVDTYAIPGFMFSHDMSQGFPLLTTKKMSLRLIASELEFFIKGITDKKWLQERNNHIWDEWCSPDEVPYATDEETKAKMLQESNLGPIYGKQWRNFNSIDQLKQVVETLKKNPNDRRMIVSAWNPVDIPHMALPPCHYAFQVTVINGKLNLLWNQRSVDVALGLPFNIASYGLLLHLLAKESGLKEGKLVGFLADTHIYKNHIKGICTQTTREPFPLPKIVTENFTSIFDWKYTDTKLINYQSWEKIDFEIAV